MDKAINPPTISVFMAAYNAADYIAEAISSILQQTFQDFELLIVNDGSTDKTVEVIQSFTDPRIRLIHNDVNRGLVFTRNRALEEVKGEFIAIMDSDDIAVPERLQLQYNYMLQNPTVALCSGHAALIDSQGQLTGDQFTVPTGDAINMELLFGNPFINPGALFKTAVLREFHGYRDFAPAEDFEFFLRLSEKYPVANIDHLLVYYRVHDKNSSAIQASETKALEVNILRDMYERWGVAVDEHYMDLHYALFSKAYQSINFPELMLVLYTLKMANKRTERFPLKAFDARLFSKWYEIIMIKKPGSSALSLLFKPELFNLSYLSFKQFRRVFKQSLRGYLSVNKKKKSER